MKRNKIAFGKINIKISSNPDEFSIKEDHDLSATTSTSSTGGKFLNRGIRFTLIVII